MPEILPRALLVLVGSVLAFLVAVFVYALYQDLRGERW